MILFRSIVRHRRLWCFTLAACLLTAIPRVSEATNNLPSGLKAQFDALCPSGTRLVYVATTGSDTTGTGAVGAPFKTLQKALGQAVAGDKILLAAGTYAAASNMYGKLGTASAWITIQPVDDSSVVVLDGSNISDAGVLYFQQCAYFGVYGLEVRAVQTQSTNYMSGIAIFRGCHHGVVWANRIHDVPSGGVNCFWVDVNTTYNIPAGSHDVLDIGWNTIWGAAGYDPNNSSGISVAEPIDSGTGTWPDGYAYHVHDNYVFNVQCYQPYTNGGFNFVTDGNGVSIDAFSPSNHPSQVPNYTKSVLVKGNILTGNGGRGVHVHNALNTAIQFNVGIGNLRTNSPAINNSSEYDGDTNATVAISGNAILPRNTPNWSSTKSAFTVNNVLGGTQAVTGNNIDQRTFGYTYFTGPLSDSALTVEQPRSVFTPKMTAIQNWRAVYFSGNSNNTGTAADTATPYGDGVSNLVKYAFNLNPQAADATPMTANGSKGLPLESVDGSKHLTLTFVRRTAASNPAITYTPQFGNSLDPGALAANPAATTTVTPIDAVWERVVVTDSVVGGQAPRFARVLVTDTSG